MHTTVKQTYVLMLSKRNYAKGAQSLKTAMCGRCALYGNNSNNYKTYDRLAYHWLNDKCPNNEWWRNK